MYNKPSLEMALCSFRKALRSCSKSKMNFSATRTAIQTTSLIALA